LTSYLGRCPIIFVVINDNKSGKSGSNIKE